MSQLRTDAPPILYKYRSNVDRDVKALLVDRVLYCSTPRELNDPFDCYPAVILPPGKLLEESIERFVASAPPGRSDDARYRAQALVSSDRCRRAFVEELYDEDLSEYGVCSLSAAKDIPLLWAFYAASSRGFLVGYRGRDEPGQEAVPAVPVRYPNDRPTINPLEPDTIEPLEVLFSKPTSWAHEDEWRFIRVPDKGGVGRMSVPPRSIVEVILGPRISDDDATTVIEAATALEDEPRIFKARLLAQRYGMEFIPI